LGEQKTNSAVSKQITAEMPSTPRHFRLSRRPLRLGNAFVSAAKKLPKTKGGLRQPRKPPREV
jgi:hypothetical protein